ncbi:MAG: phosphate signaling complex protein PhoU [Eubacteriales bacterium]
MRRKYEEELTELKTAMVQMGALCEEAISLAIRSLETGEEALLARVNETDASIDRAQRDIEAQCMRILLLQQPVARDLRTISSAMRMISDMERIGDQASDIAGIARYVLSRGPLGDGKLKQMAGEAVSMVTDSIDSFVTDSAERARQVVLHDDVVDGLFDEIKRSLIETLRADGADGEYCLDLLMIAKYLERIGDHAVNIAGWVEYALTGEYDTDA